MDLETALLKSSPQGTPQHRNVVLAAVLVLRSWLIRYSLKFAFKRVSSGNGWHTTCHAGVVCYTAKPAVTESRGRVVSLKAAATYTLRCCGVPCRDKLRVLGSRNQEGAIFKENRRYLNCKVKYHAYIFSTAYRAKYPRKRYRNATNFKEVYIMPRMSKTRKLEMNFFINSSGRIEFNRLCCACVNDCKQSHRAAMVFCHKYKSKRSVR